VVHTCNPSYSRGGGRQVGRRFKVFLGKVSWRPYLKSKLKEKQRYKWVHIVCHVWGLDFSLTVLLWRLTQVAYISGICSFLLTVLCGVAVPQCNSSPVGGHLSCFWFWAVMNKVAVHAQFSCKPKFSFLWDKCPESNVRSYGMHFTWLSNIRVQNCLRCSLSPFCCL
jgi:hypothetical protein